MLNSITANIKNLTLAVGTELTETGNELNNELVGNNGDKLANLIDAGDITFSRSKYDEEYRTKFTFFSLAEIFFYQYSHQKYSTGTASVVFVNSDLQRISFGLHTSEI